VEAATSAEAGGVARPGDARHLVESVYGDDALGDIPDALQAAALAEEGERMAQHSQAELNLLNIASGYQREESNIWWDEALTPTRLGEASRTVYLARYENGEIVPWAGSGRYAWMRSALSLRKALAEEACDFPKISQELMDDVCDSLPGKGKWGVLVILHSTVGGWQGGIVNANGERLVVNYDRVLGVLVGNEVQEYR